MAAGYVVIAIGVALASAALVGWLGIGSMLATALIAGMLAPIVIAGWRAYLFYKAEARPEPAVEAHPDRARA